MSHNNVVNNLFLNQKVVQVTTDYTILPDDVIIEVGSLSAPITLTLPAPSSENRGKCYLIKDSLGQASTQNISLQTLSAQIDGGTAPVALSQNYAALKLFCDGANYFTYSSFSVKELAIGSWTRYDSTEFVPGSTVIQTTIDDWSTNVFNKESRLDLTGLNKIGTVVGLQEGGQNITFTQTGTYYIGFSSCVEERTYPVCQLVRNDDQLLLAFPTQNYRYSGDMRPLELFYIGNFTAKDSIDVRFGLHTQGNSFSFYTIQYYIKQLTTSF